MPSIVYKFAGPTVAVTVTTTEVDFFVTANAGEQSNFAAFLNTGPTLSAVQIAPAGNLAVVFPTDNNPQPNTFVLGANMQQPEIIAVPANQFAGSVITNSSVSPVLYITPVVVQS